MRDWLVELIYKNGPHKIVDDALEKLAKKYKGFPCSSGFGVATGRRDYSWLFLTAKVARQFVDEAKAYFKVRGTVRELAQKR